MKYAYTLLIAFALIGANHASANIRIDLSRGNPMARATSIEKMGGKHLLDTIRERITSHKEENQEKRTEVKQDAAERHVENAGRVITALVDRLSKIADRIDSRIAKLKESGIDTSLAEGYISAARTNLNDAKSSASKFASLDLSSGTEAVFENVRKVILESRNHLKEAHKNLMMAVSSLSSSNNSSNASSTPKEQEE